MLRRLFLLFSLAALPAFPVAKEILQLQRDVALLQDQLRAVQKTVDERFAVTQQLMNQNLDAATKISNSIAVLERALQEQQKATGGSVASVNSRIDTMAQQFQSLRDSIDEMNNRMKRLDQQLVDIKNIVSTVPAPAAPATPATPPAPSAADLFRSAVRDYQAGNYNLAGPQFDQYLKLYPNTEQAADAQYYLGDMFFQGQQWGLAVEAFDLLLERYSDSRRAPDAQFKKGQAYLKQSKRDAAAKEFRELIKKYPNSPAASQAAEALRGLGLSARTPPGKSGGKARRK